MPIPLQREEVPSLLDGYRLSYAEQDMVFQTWQLLTQQCMESKGYEFFIPPFDAVSGGYKTPMTSAEVQEYGYNAIDLSSSVPGEAAETMARYYEDPAFRAALIGDEDDLEDGCQDQAIARVDPDGGEFQNLDAVVETAQIDASVRAEGRPEVVSAEAEWSACMAERGYDFDKPRDALSTFVGEPVDDAQRQTRIADLECQHSVSYEYTVSVVEADEEASWLEENPVVVTQIEAAKADYLADISSLHASLEQ